MTICRYAPMHINKVEVFSVSSPKHEPLALDMRVSVWRCDLGVDKIYDPFFYSKIAGLVIFMVFV